MRRLLVVLFLFVTIGFPVPAQAEAKMQAHISSVSHQWLSARDNLDVTLQYFTTSPHDEVSVTTSVSTSALGGRSQIPTVLNNESLPSMHTVSTDTATNVSDGWNSISLSLTKSQLHFTTSGAYVLHFELTAGNESSQTTLVIPYIASSRFRIPLNLVVLWPITSEPSINADYSPLGDGTDFGSGSTLNALVASGNSNITWVTDPDIIAQANNTGNTAWIDDLTSKLTTAENFTLPFANADLDALHARKYTSVVAAALGSSVGKNLLYIPATGDVSAPWWKTVAASNGVLAVSDICYPATSSIATTNGLYDNSAIGNKALVVDSQLSTMMSSGISTDNSATTHQEALLADLLITHLERPNTKRVVVINAGQSLTEVGAEQSLSVLRGLTAPWLKPTTVSDALKQPSGSRTHKGCSTSTVPKSVRTQLAITNTLHKHLASLLLGTIEERQLFEAMLRTTSMQMSTTRRGQVLASLKTYSEALDRAVRIMSSGQVILPAEQGKIPITIKNSLSTDVHVMVRAEGIPSVRVMPQDSMTITVGAGKRKSIEIPTRLLGSDVGIVQLQLTDLQGNPIGKVVKIQVASSAYAGIARWVMAIAGTLLVILLGRKFMTGIRRVAARRRKNADHE
ncbi:MAG: hypothetical protein RL410_251 [Actinomycetota bacterium]|jgi:hypothetical protein